MGPPQATTSQGTRGGVRYFGDDDSDREEAKEFKVESKHSTSAKQVPETKTSPGAPSTKQVSRTSASKSPVGQATTPPLARTQTTPTKGSKSKGTGTTPKKSTPQSLSSTPSSSAAAGGSGTTPSMSRAESFLRYKNRAGPRAPGSKPIPEGIKVAMIPNVCNHAVILILV